MDKLKKIFSEIEPKKIPPIPKHIRKILDDYSDMVDNALKKGEEYRKNSKDRF
jgi:hypothetical protein